MARQQRNTLIGVLLDELEYRRSRLLERIESIRARLEGEFGAQEERPHIGGGALVSQASARIREVFENIRRNRPGIIPIVLEDIRSTIEGIRSRRAIQTQTKQVSKQEAKEKEVVVVGGEGVKIKASEKEAEKPAQKATPPKKRRKALVI